MGRGRPLDRLMGVEQEYAVVHRPPPGTERPGNKALFLALRAVLSRRVVVRHAGGLWGWVRARVFTQTGGSLYFESMGDSLEAGLVEAATPECRGPTQTLAYSRAWDRLLQEASEEVGRQLGAPLVLRKNGRDAQGHVYGPQESYEVDIASGPALGLLRLGLALLAPVVLVSAAAHLLVVGSVMVGWVALASLATSAELLVASTAQMLGRDVRAEPTRWTDLTMPSLPWVERLSLHLSFGPPVVAFSLLLRLTAWRPFRRGGLAFLATRMVVSGAGTLTGDDALHLSEKASAIRRVMRWSVAPDDRGLLETGHLHKGLLGPLLARPSHLLALFRRRQRLQLGMGDANLCDVAEYLKLGTTALVLDLADAGCLEDAPRLRDPVGAAQAVSRDGPGAQVALADGRRLTALEVQRWYCERAIAWLADLDPPHAEAHALVVRWAEVLDLLEHEPDALVGQLDWVTKRALLADAGEDLSWEARKKVDLRYHELGVGYHAWLDGAGVVEHLLDDETLARAMEEPPADSPARLRGALVRHSPAASELVLDWGSGTVDGRLVRFDPDRDGL